LRISAAFAKAERFWSTAIPPETGLVIIE